MSLRGYILSLSLIIFLGTRLLFKQGREIANHDDIQVLQEPPRETAHGHAYSAGVSVVHGARKFHSSVAVPPPPVRVLANGHLPRVSRQLSVS